MSTLKELIDMKNNYAVPYYANWHTVKNFETDMNIVPYPRFYRGKFDNPRPIIMERAAGYREQLSDRYWKDTVPNKYMTDATAYQKKNNSISCFETACSTVLPCKRPFVDSKEAKIQNTDDSVYISP